ncbi:helix-turn-helix transcriptional regulator [Dasania marina]|uniref:helix-turn-helix transcriptional regulator n=1 Tax=Dasania marina TaxID=471499 RepID=UPI0030DDAADF|tara:strand:+ start:50814 stop:51587 length:774 start_codon:yes stop_codon:yes gene_type:complete
MSWYLSLSEAIHELGNDNFFKQLVTAIEKKVPALSAVMYIMPKHQSPALLYQNYPAEVSIATQQWLSGPYLLDPFYIKSFDGSPEDLYHLTDAAPDGFTESHYYKSYYRDTDCNDEVCYLAHINTDLVVSLALARVGSSPLFTPAELSTFDTIKPLVISLIKQQSERMGNQTDENQRLIHQHLKEKLASFGEQLLTKREREIVQLVFKGNSSKSMASRLHLSLDTINMHKRNAYKKLNISSQSELFSLLINRLSSHH